MNIDIFAKNEKKTRTLVQTIRIYSLDIGMEFGIEKCAMMITEKKRRETTEAIELPNQKIIRRLRENENYKYLGILETDTIKQRRKKKKIKILQKNKNTSRNKTLPQKSKQMNKYLGRNLCKILWIIL